MKVFCIVGYSSSGKTSTAEALIRELKRRGYTVGAVKESHHSIRTDEQGTNTSRLRQAGAPLVAARSQNETHLFFDTRISIERILRFFNFDFVVLEGVSDIDVPQIVTAIDIEGIKAKRNERTFAVSGVISEKLQEYKGLPVINGVLDTIKLADLVEEMVNNWVPDGAQ